MLLIDFNKEVSSNKYQQLEIISHGISYTVNIAHELLSTGARIKLVLWIHLYVSVSWLLYFWYELP